MEAFNFLNSFIWGTPTLLILIFSGIMFTVRTGFFQIRHIRHWLKCTIFSSVTGEKKPNDDKTISQFQAMCSALSATLGTGNIAGVSAALAIGGAGSVFWMWISAIFGMMTGFAENLLGIYYRKKDENGEWTGGAMCYISDGLSEKRFIKHLAKPLAVIFAVLCTLSAFGMGNMAQMNSAAGALQSNFGIPPIITGIALAIPAALIIFGGIKRVAGITEKIVPLMSGFYIIGAIWILASNATQMPAVLGSVFEGAFGIDAVNGGISGYLIRQAVTMGFRRGVFSNEAGLGTSVAAHTASDVKEPCIQGMWSIFEVFFDTIIMCSLTAFILLSSSCNAPTAKEAFSQISLSPQYFRLTDDNAIITNAVQIPIIMDYGETTEFRTIYSTGFELSLGQGSTTFSNIMTVKGIQTVAENGSPVFLDKNNTVPLIESVEICEVNGSQLATYAFSMTFGSAAGKLLAVAVVLFAFSTVIGWSCFGTQSAVYIFGKKALLPFRIIFILFSIAGAVLDFSAVWEICDLVNGLMIFPNMFALLVLSPKVLEITKNYCHRTFSRKKIPPMLSAYSEEQRAECNFHRRRQR